MKQYLDGYTKANEILLELRHPKTKAFNFVLVESINDCKVYKKFFNLGNVIVTDAYAGVKHLIDALEILNKKTNKVIAIRDADFCHINSDYDNIPNLFYTDFHDIEMTMISSDITFEAVVIELLNESMDYLNLRSQILQLISFVGKVRLFNHINNMELELKDLPFHELINEKLALLKSKCVDIINKRSKNRLRNVTIKELNKLNTNSYNLLNLCSGHDFINALYVYNKINYGVQKGGKVISQVLRAAYNYNEFSKTQLWSSIMKYQNEMKLNLLRIQ